MPFRRSTLVRPLAALAMVAVSSLSALAQQPPTPSRVRGTIEASTATCCGEVAQRRGRQAAHDRRHAGGRHHQDCAGRYQGRLLHRHHHGAGTGRQPTTRSRCMCFRKTCAAPGRARGPTICSPNSHHDQCDGGREPWSAMTATPCWSNTRTARRKSWLSPDTPVVTYVPADKSDLKAGAKVIAFMKKLPDGSFETNRVSVGRDGLTPPM